VSDFELFTRLISIELKLDRTVRLLEPTPTAVEAPLPERCNGIEPGKCGLQDPDARASLASFADSGAWQCRGCRARTTGE